MLQSRHMESLKKIHQEQREHLESAMNRVWWLNFDESLYRFREKKRDKMLVISGF